MAPRTVTAAAAFAAMALAVAVGCSTRPTDAGLAEQIKAQMFSDPALKDSALQVSVSGGEVTLAGAVTSDGARLRGLQNCDTDRRGKKSHQPNDGRNRGRRSGSLPCSPDRPCTRARTGTQSASQATRTGDGRSANTSAGCRTAPTTGFFERQQQPSAPADPAARTRGA